MLRVGSIAPFILLAACGGRSADPVKQPVVVRVRSVELSKSGAESARYSATIMPDARVDLAFKVGGYIEWLEEVKGPDGKPRSIQEGDPVKKGQALARVKIADVQQQLNAAKAQLAEATAAREQARSDFDRGRGLFETQGISRAELDAMRSRFEAAKARVEGASAQVEAAKNAVGDTALRSPLDGMVMKRVVEVGALVAPGTPGFIVADTARVKAVFGVPDTLVESLELGATLAITTEARGGAEFTGRITRIAPSADLKTRTFEVETTIDNPRQELKTGFVASLKLAPAQARAEPTALLPLTAIVRSATNPDGFAVFVVDGEVARRRDVELGDFMGDQIPVLAGLKEGERVIVMGATLVSDGERVGIIP